MNASRYLYLLLLSMCPIALLNAQATCPGTALAPVFKQTFGVSATSATKSVVPSGFITNYTFNGSSALSDGQYMVTPLVQNSQKNDWAAGGDHTGDVNGNMFLVNAGTGASLFFKQQVNNLCPGSTYSFSAWLANMNTTSLTLPICGASIVYPNVTFYIKNTSGTVLASFNTGNIPLTASRNVAPNWLQYGFQFSLPAGTTTLVLEMVDFYGGLPQCGNDLAIDDIMFSACTPEATISINTATALCAGSNTTISSSLLNSPFTTPAYQWQKSTDGGNTWTNIGAASTTATDFPLNNVGVSDGAKYRVLVGPDTQSFASTSCITASNVITLTVNPLPSLSMNVPPVVCSGTTLQLASVVTGALTPYAYDWAGPSFTSSSANPSILNINSAANGGMYALTVTDANGCAAYASANVSIATSPTTAHAGADQSVCFTTTTTLDGNIPVQGNGVWMQTGGPATATIDDPNLPNTILRDLVPGVYTFRWIISMGPLNPCANSVDDVTIEIYAPTDAGFLSGDATVCENSNTGSVTLIGYTGNIIQWESSVDGGVTWSVINNTTSAYSYLNLSETTYLRVLVQNGNCTSQYSNTVIIVTDRLSIGGTISGNATVCAAVNSGTLTLTGHTGNVLEWLYSVNGGSTWNSISVTNSIYQYQNLAANTLFRANVKNGACAAQYSGDALVSVAVASNAGLLSGDATVCALANAGTITLTNYTGTILQWESSVDNGNTWSTINNTTDQYNYHSLASTTSYRALVQNSVCASSYSNNITIHLTQPTVAGLLTGDATVCAGANTGTLTLTGQTGNILQWEFSTDNGNTWQVINHTNTQHNYQNISLVTIYRALVQNGNCAAQYSNTVRIDTDNLTVPGSVNGNATVCITANSGNISLTAQTGNILQWESSNDNGSTWSVLTGNNAVYSYQNLLTNTQYKALVKNGACPALYSGTVTVEVLPVVDPAHAGNDQFLCASNTTILTGNTPSIGNGLWRLIAGPSNIAFANATSASTSVTGLSNGTYYFEWTLSNGTCMDTRDTVIITVYASITNAVDNATQMVCKNQQVIINGQPASGGQGTYQYQWEKSYDGINWVTIPMATGVSYTMTADTTVFIRRNISSLPCTSIGATTIIKVQASLSNNTIGNNQQICPGQLIQTITGSTPTGGDGNYIYEWQQSTDNGNTWTTLTNQTAKDLTTQIVFTRDTWLRRIVSTTICNGSFSIPSNNINITIKPAANATVQYAAGVYCRLDTSILFTPTTTLTDSIRWDFGDGTVLTTLPNAITHVYRKPGHFLPSLQLISSNNACAVTLQLSDKITIDEIKTGFTVSAVYNCGKTMYEFRDTSSSYFPVTDRLWYINGNPSGTDVQWQNTFTNYGSNTATLRVQNAYGCSRSLDAKFTVNIYTYPKVNINAVGEACLNNLMELTSIINSSDEVKARVWNLGNGSSATDSVVQVSYFSEGKYQVKLTVATINSCYDSAFKQILIHPIPNVAIKADNTVCLGDSIELKADGASSYIWKDQNDNVVCNNCNGVKIRPQRNTQYKVIGYSEFGCSQVASTSVRVIPRFKLSAKTADTVCIGETKILSVSGGASYTWRNDPGLSAYNISSPIAKPSATTTFRVIGKDSYNCFADSADIKLTVGLPTPIQVGRDTSVLSGIPIQLHAVSSLQDIRKWQWKGNATFSCLGCAEPTAKIILDECISCTATNIFGCTSSDTICITTFCPGSEVFVPNAFSPDGDGINDILFVQGRGVKLIKSFRVFSRWGEMVFEKTNFLPGDKSSGWDGRIRGKMASPDVFVYVCEAICEKGTPAIFKGNTAVLK